MDVARDLIDQKAASISRGESAFQPDMAQFANAIARSTHVLFGFLTLIIMCQEPFNIISNQTFLRYSTLATVDAFGKCSGPSMYLIKRALRKLHVHVGALIKASLRLKRHVFLEWDSWGKAFMKHKYSVLLIHAAGLTKPIMLAFSPLLNEAHSRATDYSEWMLFVIAHYGLTPANVMALIGDNCSTNKATGARSFIHSNPKSRN